MKFAHILNVTEINESKKASYLHVAQPVTMKTMVAAKEYAKDTVDVDLLAVKHKSESLQLEPGFEWTPDIQKYAFEYIDILKKDSGKKPLPRLVDIINAGYENSDAEYLIYTNLDIGLQPHFYKRLSELIIDGYDSICINRRDLPKRHNEQLLDHNCIELLYSLEGEAHPGIDCMLFKRHIVPELKLGNVYIGFPPIGQVLKTQVEKYSENPIWVKDEKLSFHIGQDLAWLRDGKESLYMLVNEDSAGPFYVRQMGKNSWSESLTRRLNNKFKLFLHSIKSKS